MDIDPLPGSPVLNLLLLSAQAIEFHSPSSWAAWSCIVIIAGCCLLISAFVSGSEIAYFGLTPQEIDSLEEAEDKRSRQALNLISHSERLLATILISNNLVNITLVVLLTFAINQVMVINSTVVNFLLQTVFLTFLLLLFGEIFPKLVARGRTLQWVLFSAPGVTALYRFTGPLAKLMVKSTTIVNKIITKKSQTISTDELEQALKISDIKEGQEKEMLEGILSFGEKEVSDIMISRVDVTAIEYHDSWKTAIETIKTSGFSRIPVYDKSQDTIKGVLYSKDVLPYLERNDDGFEWQKLLRPAYFVPESRMIDDLLEDFRKKKIHIAIVVDEYGGTRGIVTLEDVIEEIVGEIDDEYDETSDSYKKIGPDRYIFDGKTPLADFCRIIGVDEERLGDVGEAETLAGLLLEIKGDFPTTKEILTRSGIRFQVIQVERHRITKIKVTVEPDSGAENDDSKREDK